MTLRDAPPAHPGPAGGIGPLRQAADFRRLLALPPRERSAHFAVHYLNSVPTRPRNPARPAAESDLSTGKAPLVPSVVDESPAGHWLGCVVPKRHARRAVTRNSLKRQIRAAMARHVTALPPGLWLVRLRGPFAPSLYPSADSPALRQAARDELDRVLRRAAAVGLQAAATVRPSTSPKQALT